MAYSFKLGPRFVIKIVVYLGVLMMVLISTAASWLLYSRAAPQWLISQINQYSQMQIEVESIEGSLSGPITLYGVSYKSLETSIYATRMDFDWTPSALLQRRVLVKSLDLTGLTVDVKEVAGSNTVTEAETGKFNIADVKLPVDINVESISAQHVTLSKQSNQLLVINTLEASALFDSTGFNLKKLEIDSDIAAVSLAAHLNPVDRYPAKLFGHWKYLVQTGQSVEGELSISGNIDSLDVDAAITSPLKIKLTGNLNHPLDNGVWHAHLVVNDFNAQQVDRTWPRISGGADLALSGTYSSYLVEGKLNLRDLKQFSLKADVGLRGDNKNIYVDKLRLQESQSRASLSTVGHYDLTSKIIDANLSWKGVKYPAKGDVLLRSDTGELSVKGHLDNYSAVMKASIFEKNINEADLVVEAQGDTEKINFNKLSLNLLGGVVAGSGGVEWIEALQAGANLTWQQVKWHGEIGELSSDGAIDISYFKEKYNFDVTTFVDGSFVPDGRWSFQGQGDLNQLDNVKIHGNTLNGTIDGLTSLSWQEFIDWDAQVSFSGINPGEYWPEFAGDLFGEIKAQGQVQSNVVSTTIEVGKVVGVFRDMPLQTNAYIEMIDEDIEVFSLDLSLAESTVQAAGRWAEDVSLVWHLDLPNLNLLTQDAAGGLSVKGNVHGKKNAPILDVALDGNFLRWKEASIEKLHAIAALDLINYRQLTSSINVENMNAYGLTRALINFSTEGTDHAHEISLNLSSDEVDLNMRATGAWDGVVWSGVMTNLDVGSEQWGEWSLKDIVKFDAAKSNYNLADLCLNSKEKALFCLDGGYIDGLWRVAAKGEMFPLGQISQYMEDELTLKATTNFDLDASNKNGSYEVTMNASIDQAALQLKQFSSDYLQLSDIAMDVQLSSLGLDVAVNSIVGESDALALNVFLPGMVLTEIDTPQQKLDASLSLNMKNIQWLKSFIPEVDDMAGHLLLDLSATGVLSAPEISGGLEVKDGMVSIPRAGLVLTAIDINAVAANDNHVNYQIKAVSDNGSLTIDGSTLLSSTEAWPTNLKVLGENFEILRIPEARITVSPNMALQSKNKTVSVSGEVFIPYAKLQPRDMTTAVKVSDDMVIVGSAAPIKEETSWKIDSRVKLVLGERVKFYGYGLESNVTGNVLLIDEPGQVTTAKGELVIIDGRYRAYGQRLKIENGKILFTGGPVSNPGLDIRATRQVGEVVAGVKVRGTILSPNLEMFTMPAMGQANALSYLVLGRPMDDTSSTQEDGALLLNAAIALGLTGGDMLARQVGDRFGFEEMRVDTGESGEASLVVGRYLMPRLYISYGIGLLESLDSVKLRYELAKRWRLVAEKQGDSQGSDLMYTIER